MWAVVFDSGPGESPLSYHGLHRLPALGLGSRQEEIFGISPEIHLQIDVEVHGVARLHLNAYYTRRTRSVFPDKRRLFGLISPIRSTVWLSDKGWEAYFVFTSASWARPPCTMCPEQSPLLPLVRKKTKAARHSAARRRAAGGQQSSAREQDRSTTWIQLPLPVFLHSTKAQEHKHCNTFDQ